jgi:hypothetical protein
MKLKEEKMQLTENTKANIKSTYEIVRGLILMMMVIMLGLAITTGTADAKMSVVSKGVKPSERREWGVKSINIDKSFAVDKYCTEHYSDAVEFDACVKRIESSIDTRYEMLDVKK